MHSANPMAVGLMALIAPAAAFWRLPCTGPIVTERADPIINPGEVSSHVHTIMGGNGFGFEMDYNDTQASTCSSCTVTKDFSNYWVPTLYYKAQNGSFISVTQNGGGTIYYLQRSDPADPEYDSGLLAFPEGFRMVAGNPMLRNYTDTVEQQAISFACLGTNNAETNGLPDYNCPDGLRAQVFFPSCWDGVNLDSEDHKSHMSYPSVYNAGHCPSDFPKRTISLFYEVTWVVDDFKDDWYGSEQPFVFANGDTTGYGYHGDFVNGWDVPTLQEAVTTCTDASGVIENCPVFSFFDDSVAQGCKIPASVDEQVTGILSELPGCNPVQSGPEMAIASTGCGATTAIGLPENPYVDLTVSKGFEYLGCGTDVYGQTRTLDGTSTTAENMTVEYCVDYCIDQGFSIAGMEYSDECYCGDSVASDRAPVAGLMGNCYMPCAGDSTENCGGAGTISLYQKCSSGSCTNAVYGVNNSTYSSSGGKKVVVNSSSQTDAVVASATPSSTASAISDVSATSTALSATHVSGSASASASSYPIGGYNSTAGYNATSPTKGNGNGSGSGSGSGSGNSPGSGGASVNGDGSGNPAASNDETSTTYLYSTATSHSTLTVTVTEASATKAAGKCGETVTVTVPATTVTITNLAASTGKYHKHKRAH